MSALNADGYFDLRWSNDKLQVLLDVYPPQGGGRNANAEEIVAAIQRRGVTYGFQFDAIDNAVKHVAINAAPVMGVLAAQGQLPVNGTDAQVVWKIDSALASQPLPVRPNGLPDYCKYDPARLVKAGQELAAVIPGIPGTPGKTLVVPFEIIPQAPGRESPILAGPGVRLSANRQRYEAEATGFVELRNDRLSIHALSWVAGDLEGGDHTFPGGVIVAGRVRNASVTARGPVAVGGQITGSHVRGSGCMLLTEAEKSRIVADGDVYVDRNLADCEVITPSRIIGLEGSSFHGGTLISSSAIEAWNLGTEAWPVTDAVLGAEVYATIRIHEIEHEIEVSETNVKRIAIALKPLTSITSEPLSPARRQLVQTLMDQRREIEQQIKLLHAERRTRQMTHVEPTGAVRIAGQVYPGVRLDLYGQRLIIEQGGAEVEFRAKRGGNTVDAIPLRAKAA